jgi:hypothetical protein
VAGLLGSGSVRFIRGEPSALDSAWSRGAGHVLIHWPANASVARWSRRSSVDTVGAVSTSATVVARFARVWSPAAIAGRPIARWIDGEPAATEQAMGEGCMREVAIVIDPAGDLTLRPAFRSFIQSLLMPCGGERAAARLAPAMLDSLAGTGPLAAAMTLRDRHEVASPWTTWLLIAGAMLLIVELAVRRQRTTAA